MNYINDEDKCFQYAATNALNYEETEKNSHKIPKIQPFISKYNCKGINYPSGKDDQKKFEKNKPAIALNLLHVNEMNRYPAYISKHNSNFEKLILLMIPNGERSHYLTAVVQKAMVVFIV